MKYSKIVQNRILPYLPDIIPEDVAQFKFLISEKKVTWVYGTIREY
jgi:hypothetical protein